MKLPAAIATHDTLQQGAMCSWRQTPQPEFAIRAPSGSRPDLRHSCSQQAHPHTRKWGSSDKQPAPERETPSPLWVVKMPAQHNCFQCTISTMTNLPLLVAPSAGCLKTYRSCRRCPQDCCTSGSTHCSLSTILVLSMLHSNLPRSPVSHPSFLVLSTLLVLSMNHIHPPPSPVAHPSFLVLPLHLHSYWFQRPQWWFHKTVLRLP
mmetsp:Transcript_77065/g.152708  ORF Transcript_77065/g.152708 Transcript_77065/m.152708 type:complete len:206 (+) Transcript_77065:271-888(+)